MKFTLRDKNKENTSLHELHGNGNTNEEDVGLSKGGVITLVLGTTQNTPHLRPKVSFIDMTTTSSLFISPELIFHKPIAKLIKFRDKLISKHQIIVKFQ